MEAVTEHWHPSDEDLILHFYGEDRGVEQRVDEHLSGCASCRNAMLEITETLKLVDLATVTEPGPVFEQAMWARVQKTLAHNQPALRQAQVVPFAAPQRRTRVMSRWLLPALGAAAAVVAIVFAANRWAAPSSAPGTIASDAATTPATAANPVAEAKARERVLLYAAEDHFQQAEVVLVELMNGPQNGEGDLGFERDMATGLVASGRLYRETALENGDGQLVKALEDLESVLVEVARSPEQAKRKDLNTLRTRINHDSVLFKVRAVSSDIRERQRALSVVALSEGSL